MTDTILLTQEGFNKLKQELADLQDKKRPQAVLSLQKAREMGDLSENSAYTAAKEELSFVDRRIQELEELMKKTKIITQKSEGGVTIGSCVTIESKLGKDVVTVVGDIEADVIEKKISSNSPLGKALMGKKINDTVEITAPAGKLCYTIIDIA